MERTRSKAEEIQKIKSLTKYDHCPKNWTKIISNRTGLDTKLINTYVNGTRKFPEGALLIKKELVKLINENVQEFDKQDELLPR